MIENIEVRNFQSLEKIDLELAPFTVVVGQSSSGKSALVRSLSTLFSNRRGTDFISHGTTTSVITATLPQGKVSLARSLTASKNKYTIIPEGGEPVTFTKLGGDTPPEISEFVKLSPKDAVTVAQQFDKPFLLADSPAQAAQTLGALTNVHVIFEAAREAKRQRLSSSQSLKTKQQDLESIESRLADFVDLEGQENALLRAEEGLRVAEKAQRKLDSLRSAVAALRSTKAAIAEAERKLAVEVPSLDRMETAHRRLAAFESAVDSLKEAGASVRSLSSQVENLETETTELEREYLSLLKSMGTCPTCMQTIKE